MTIKLDEDARSELRDTVGALIEIGKKGELDRSDAPTLFSAISTILKLNRAIVPLLETSAPR